MPEVSWDSLPETDFEKYKGVEAASIRRGEPPRGLYLVDWIKNSAGRGKDNEAYLYVQNTVKVVTAWGEDGKGVNGAGVEVLNNQKVVGMEVPVFLSVPCGGEYEELQVREIKRALESVGMAKDKSTGLGAKMAPKVWAARLIDTAKGNRGYVWFEPKDPNDRNSRSQCIPLPPEEVAKIKSGDLIPDKPVAKADKKDAKGGDGKSAKGTEAKGATTNPFADDTAAGKGAAASTTNGAGAATSKATGAGADAASLLD